MTPEGWKEKGDHQDILGLRMFYVEENREHQETVLFVHGFPTSSFDWAPIWKRLADHYNLLALDMLGFGFSDKPNPHTYSIHEQADLVIELVRQRGLKACHILGHDYGDTVVQEIMARHNADQLPFSVQSVCFLNGGLFPETHQALLIQKLLLSPLGPLINKLTSKKQFDKSFSSVFGLETKPTAQELDDFWNIIISGNGKHIFHNLMTYINNRREHRERWIAAIADFAGPIALINGSFDPVSGAHMVVRYKELLGEPSFLKEYKDIGHYPAVEAPEQVAIDYLEFLS